MSKQTVRVKNFFNMIARVLLRFFDVEYLKNEALIIILLGIAMYGLFFFEFIVLNNVVFDNRLHWIPEVFVFFFAARVFKNKKPFLFVFVTNWIWLTCGKLYRFGEVPYPHYYEMLFLYVTFASLGYLSKRYIPTERFKMFRADL